MRAKNQNKSIQSTISKPIFQYTLDGKRVGVFESVQKAAEATGGSPEYIKKVADGEGLSSAKFHWSWTNRPTIDIKLVWKQKIVERRQKFGVKVTQYDMNGNRIAQFNSIQEAAIATGAGANAIRDVIKKKAGFKTAKGFYWQKGYGKAKIDLSGYDWGSESAALKLRRPVIQLTPDGKKINKFISVSEAARIIKCNPSQISNVCHGRANLCRGYKWALVKR
jgi:hypothetical protein